MSLPAYEIFQTYEWNYQHGPDALPEVDVPACPGDWSYCGFRVNSPLGMPAGPLLNSRWIHYYGALGFDVLVYKTVRSSFRASFDPPNLLPVVGADLAGEGSELSAAPSREPFHSWAISFGMPSRDPAEWRTDVERARRGMRPGQVLVVSVVASPRPGWTLDRLAADFADCAVWAEEAGAQVVEANLSCPNVCTQEADLYLNAAASGVIAGTIRSRMKQAPLALKIGLFRCASEAEALVAAVTPFAASISTTNSITATVSAGGETLFGGLRRGIGGAVITRRCLEELRMMRRIAREQGSPVELVSVGGVRNADDVRDRLALGAASVHLATAPMIDPMAGVRIRRALA